MYKASLLPLCYHPTTVLLVDDNLEYINQLQFQMMSWPLVTKTFISPYDLIKFTKNDYYTSYWSTKLLKEANHPNDQYQELAINIKLNELPLEVYNTERFAQISCVVSDYSMPGMNGLELLRQIKQPYVKKILLTGIADEQLAIEAFNNCEIDAFIMKSDPKMLDKMSKTILELSKRYFINLSKTAYDIISINRPASFLLSKPEFSKLFKQIINDYKIVEYYIFESCGCYIMLDANSKIYGFFIYSEDDVLSILDDLDVVNKNTIKSTPQMICYHSTNMINFPHGQARLRYLCKAQNFICDAVKYYWAITEENLEVDINKILSLNKYKNL